MHSINLQVYEPPIRNSGIAGGKFLERQPVYKPNTEDVYDYTSLYVGGTMEIFNRTFELFEADEYTYTYMENNKHVFIMADHEVLLKSLRAQVGLLGVIVILHRVVCMYVVDVDGRGFDFKAKLKGVARCMLSLLSSDCRDSCNELA